MRIIGTGVAPGTKRPCFWWKYETSPLRRAPYVVGCVLGLNRRRVSRLMLQFASTSGVSFSSTFPPGSVPSATLARPRCVVVSPYVSAVYTYNFACVFFSVVSIFVSSVLLLRRFFSVRSVSTTLRTIRDLKALRTKLRLRATRNMSVRYFVEDFTTRGLFGTNRFTISVSGRTIRFSY